MRYIIIVTLGLAAALCSPMAQATSPDLPVVPRIELAAQRALDGKVAVRLVLETQDDGEYSVTVRGPSAGATTEKAMGLAGEPIASDLVRADMPLEVDDAVTAREGEIVHVRYEIEVENADGGYKGLIVLSQAFAVGLDGTLEPIDFQEQMSRQAAGLKLDEGEEPAGGLSSQPE